MISSNLKRLFGMIFIVIGLAGVVLGGIGIYKIWQVKPVVETRVMSMLGTTKETLKTTQTGLSNLKQSLETIDGNITNLNQTIVTVAQSLNDAVPVLESISVLLQEELPATLEATQTSLETAEASAKLLDSVMRALTSIPFYPGEKYEPAVPLDVTVKNVALSLEDVPASLIEVGDELESNQENFSDIEDDLLALSVTLAGINTNISSTKITLEDYQTLLTDAGTQVTLIEESLPSTLNSLTQLLGLVIVWLIFTQMGLVVQGFLMLETRPPV